MAHLFIIAGHGAGDPGATGNGYQEAERVRVLAAKIGAYGGSDVTIADTSRNWYADNGIQPACQFPKTGRFWSCTWTVLVPHLPGRACHYQGRAGGRCL